MDYKKKSTINILSSYFPSQALLGKEAVPFTEISASFVGGRVCCPLCPPRGRKKNLCMERYEFPALDVGVVHGRESL